MALRTGCSTGGPCCEKGAEIESPLTERSEIEIEI